MSLNATKMFTEKKKRAVQQQDSVDSSIDAVDQNPLPTPQPLSKQNRNPLPESAQALVRVVRYCVSMLLRWARWERSVLEHKKK